MKRARSFTPSQVNDIRHRINVLEETVSSVAKRYGVHSSTVSKISVGQTYRDIPTPMYVANYVIYPNGRVWSKSTGKWMSYRKKSSHATVEHVDLRLNGQKRSFTKSSVISEFFG